MFLNILLLILFYNSYETFAQPNKMLPHEGYTYLEKTKSYYKYHAGGLTWREAAAACAADGARLYYAEDAAEATEIGQFLNQFEHFYSIWIAVSDLQKKGHYITTDGRPISDVYRKWDTDEPNNRNYSYRCVAQGTDNTLWVGHCQVERSFVCKYTPESKKINQDDSAPSKTERTTPLSSLVFSISTMCLLLFYSF